MNTLALINNAISVDQLLGQRALVMSAIKAAMTETLHYGKIPGCGDKPSLFQSGAQMLCTLFRLTPSYDVKQTDLPNGHREYQVFCTLSHGSGSEAITWQGVGTASTMETKHRYRNDSAFTVLDCEIPRDSKEKKADYRKKGFGMKLVEGQWVWVKYGEATKAENPDPADQFNTVLKMGKKRAYVDATITATAINDIFTQDLEDLREDLKREDFRATPVNGRIVENETKNDRQQPSNEREPSSQEMRDENSSTVNQEQPQPDNTIIWNGEIVRECKFLDRTDKKGKPYRIYITEYVSGKSASTFSETAYNNALALGKLGAPCVVTVKPGKKAGQFELIGIIEGKEPEEDQLP